MPFNTVAPTQLSFLGSTSESKVTNANGQKNPQKTVFLKFLKLLKTDSKLPSFLVGRNVNLSKYRCYHLKLVPKFRDLQDAQILEVHLVIIHLLILVSPEMPSVSASMTSQLVFHSDGFLFFVPYLGSRNLCSKKTCFLYAPFPGY